MEPEIDYTVDYIEESINSRINSLRYCKEFKFYKLEVPYNEPLGGGEIAEIERRGFKYLSSEPMDGFLIYIFREL